MECYWVLGQRLDFLAISETTGGHYSLFHVFIPAGPPGPLPHVHRDADELFFVLEGRFFVDLEDRSVELKPWQGFTVPKGVVHRTRAPERAVILMMETASIVPTGDA